MAEVAPIPSSLVAPPAPATFRALCQADDTLIYFLLNVGDGDTQLVLLPPAPGEQRRAVLVDVAKTNKAKVVKLVEDLRALEVLQPSSTPDAPMHNRAFPIVVATHPHDDHIGGIEGFISEFSSDIGEFWDSGYYHPTASYIGMMKALEDSSHIVLSQPSAGLRRFVDGVRVTVLSPSIRLKNRYDSYGVQINNSSIAIKLEYPYSRVTYRESRVSSEAVRGPQPKDRIYKKIGKVRSLILGGDAQTLAWGSVMLDFPSLAASTSPAYKALKAAKGSKPLRADVLKVPHHASKHGVNLELVEEIHPKYCLIPSVADGGRYNFPHSVAQESIREALQSTTSRRSSRKPDHELGIHYTSDVMGRGKPLGSIAMVVPARGAIQMWRFCDSSDEDVDLGAARRLSRR